MNEPRRAQRPLPPRPVAAAAAVAALLAGCGEQSVLPDRADVGPRPTLVEPVKTLLPTVHVAPASPWPEGQAPVAAAGLAVQAFATGLDHPRWLHVLPNGDVLVAESNAPQRPDQGKGIKGWVMKKMQARAGAGVPSANRITLLRDADGDGRAEQRTVFLQGLNSPFGMALVGDRFYVANTDAVMEYPYRAGATRIEEAGRKLADLPGGTLNHHWTKALVASPDGSKLYATVGSNSNVAENGMDQEEGRAAIWEIDRASGAKRLYATGLRNPNGMAWVGAGGTVAPGPGAAAPASASASAASAAASAPAAAASAPGAGMAAAPTLWTVVNERDEIGSDLVPDYLTSVRDGGFYGWPYSWFGSRVDERVDPPRPDLVARAIVPDYALGSHVAPLGLAAAIGSAVPAALGGAGSAAPAPAAAGTVSGMFVGLHGSWNRKPRSGYKVVYVPFAGGRPAGMPVDVLTGFLTADGEARGRPVGVAIDARGALLVADDVGNAVWRVAPR